MKTKVKMSLEYFSTKIRGLWKIITWTAQGLLPGLDIEEAKTSSGVFLRVFVSKKGSFPPEFLILKRFAKVSENVRPRANRGHRGRNESDPEKQGHGTSLGYPEGQIGQTSSGADYPEGFRRSDS